MEERGRVIQASGSRAEVEVAVRGECEHCSAAGVCNWTGTKAKRVLAVNPVQARAGDMVMLEVAEGIGVRTNLLVFGVPALFMLVGVLTGGLVLHRDLWAGILAGVGLALGLLTVKAVDVLVSRSGRALPVIIRRLDKDECKGVDDDKTPDSSVDVGTDAERQ